MIVVSDSGPIIHLSMAGRFDLLHALFSEVQIPAMVFEEVAETGEGLPGAAELKAAGWIKISYVDSIQPAFRLADELDAGEREAIALALEVKANHLLVDDLSARRVAQLLSIPVPGWPAR